MVWFKEEKINVLIVDDEEWWVDFASKFLKNINPSLECTGTNDPTKVINILAQQDVDIIVSDYIMQDLNGIDLLVQVKKSYPNLPFILITANANKNNFLQAKKCGVSYMISKNEHVDYLFELLNHYIIRAIKEAKYKALFENLNIKGSRPVNEKLLDLYLRGLHHDLNNLKTTIIDAISIFKDTNDERFVSIIMNAIKILDRYTSDQNLILSVKDLEKLSEKKYIHLSTVIYSILKILITGKTLARVKLEELPLVYCEINQMNQIFFNLIENAITHSDPSYIDVTFWKTDFGVYLQIRNDGRPIDDSIRKRVFNYGFTTKEQGGFGLAIVKEICDQNGWRISLTSDILTTFELFIPAIYLKDFTN